jgi:selenocysteine lyase/cysteine desulfurase
VDVSALGADFYFTNLHKHAFVPGTATVLHVATDTARVSTAHIAPSWHSGQGVITEAHWPGTRDCASWLAVPEALEYLATWRSVDALNAPTYNARGWQDAAAQLSEAWGVAPAVADPTLSSVGMGMVRLPSALDLSMDAPGEPSKGVRATLRERYGIEAAVGGIRRAWGVPYISAHGGFLRLSHAVYTTDEDIRRLRDAVSEMAAAAARHKGT